MLQASSRVIGPPGRRSAGSSHAWVTSVTITITRWPPVRPTSPSRSHACFRRPRRSSSEPSEIQPASDVDRGRAASRSRAWSSTRALASSSGSRCIRRRATGSTLAGVFREVDPPARFAFTFVLDPPDPDDLETLVALSFRDARRDPRRSSSPRVHSRPRRAARSTATAGRTRSTSSRSWSAIRRRRGTFRWPYGPPRSAPPGSNGSRHPRHRDIHRHGRLALTASISTVLPFRAHPLDAPAREPAYDESSAPQRAPKWRLSQTRQGPTRAPRCGARGDEPAQRSIAGVPRPCGASPEARSYEAAGGAHGPRSLQAGTWPCPRHVARLVGVRAVCREGPAHREGPRRQ